MADFVLWVINAQILQYVDVLANKDSYSSILMAKNVSKYFIQTFSFSTNTYIKQTGSSYINIDFTRG